MSELAELNVDVLEWVTAYLHETGHPEDAAQVRLAIAALEDRDRLRAAAQAVYVDEAGFCHGIGRLRAALEDHDG